MNDADRARLLARFWEKVNKTETCWLWTASTNRNGYGALGFWLVDRTVMVYPHRLSYEIHRGNIPQGLVLDHLCRVRHCVNPSHLEVVTRGENNRRGVGASGRNARKTHCNVGHPLSGQNLKISRRGGRICIECERSGARDRRQRTKRIFESATGAKVHELKVLDDVERVVAALKAKEA